MSYMTSQNWLPRRLGDLLSLQRGTTYKSALLGLPGSVLLGLASIQPNGGFRRDALRTYGGESPQKITLSPGDVYVSLKDVTQSGDLLGAVSRVPPDIYAGRLTQDTVKLVFQSGAVPREYVYWLLRTPQYRKYCRARAIGTTNLSLSREDFLQFPVLFPSADQLSLARTLQALDDKIELNRRMNQTLEAVAATLFKAWFVNFDPVYANMEGLKSVSAFGEMASQFPANVTASEVGAIPQGWKVQSLDALGEFLNGLAMQKHPPTGDGDLPVIKIAELRRGNTVGSDLAGATFDSRYLVDDGDLLFSWSGTLEVRIWTGGPGALNQHLFKVTAFDCPQWFIYFWLLEHLPAFRGIAAGKATTMGHIQRHHLAAANVVVPAVGVLDAADKVIGPLLQRAISSQLESRALATLRDTLLSKLLSGEIRVREAESVVGAVV